jgi:hypothetical protein
MQAVQGDVDFRIGSGGVLATVELTHHLAWSPFSPHSLLGDGRGDLPRGNDVSPTEQTSGMGNRINRLEKDLYVGNGGGRNSSVTSRINTLEEVIDDMQETILEMREEAKRISSKVNMGQGMIILLQVILMAGLALFAALHK